MYSRAGVLLHLMEALQHAASQVGPAPGSDLVDESADPVLVAAYTCGRAEYFDHIVIDHEREDVILMELIHEGVQCCFGIGHLRFFGHRTAAVQDDGQVDRLAGRPFMAVGGDGEAQVHLSAGRGDRGAGQVTGDGDPVSGGKRESEGLGREEQCEQRPGTVFMLYLLGWFWVGDSGLLEVDAAGAER